MSLQSLLQNAAGQSSSITMTTFLIDIGAALIIGFMIALVHMYKSSYTKSFVVTVAVLPAVVAMVIMIVNGSIGAGIAVAGTFSLVRFRSAPGSAKEIAAVFLAMAAGLACGMGFLLYAFLFVAIILTAILLYSLSKFGSQSNKARTMTVTIPEVLDYTDVFDDLFKKYTDECRLTHMKTSNMGSLFKLTYSLKLKSEAAEKDFVDEIRCRNGNLEIIIHRSIEEGEL
ncbi:hypothetical protein HMPREF0380_00329 [Eubacterium infirmum F0142]|nr:hypothetical protein HMPREF0380_00329 [Eubacterium infirmum F0142]